MTNCNKQMQKKVDKSSKVQISPFFYASLRSEGLNEETFSY